MTRTDYYHQPDAPKANSLVPGASAIVADGEGRIVLMRRSDNGRWALPGGVMNIGESIAHTIAREVREETGLQVEPKRIVGIYTDPGHVFAFDDGEVRDRGGPQVGGEVAVDFVGRDRLRARRERPGERAGAGTDFEECLVGFRVDRAHDFLDPRRLEEVLAVALARSHASSPRQYFSSISSISSSLKPK